MQKKIKLALIRGNGMNAWEGKLWNNLSDNFEVIGVCARKNLYPTTELNFPLKNLPTTTDGLLGKFFTYFGIFQKMSGIEKILKDFDLAHTVEIYNYYTYQACLAKKINPHLKVVTTVWDNSPDRFGQKILGIFSRPIFLKKIISKRIKYCVSNVDIFLAVSESSAEILIEEYGVNRNKIRILYPGVSKYNLINPQVTKSGRSFLMVNRLVKEKGIYDVLKAWQIFKNDSANTHSLIIVGDGPERKKMLEFIEQNKLQGIKYIPRLSNEKVRELYYSSIALILASYATPLWQEQFGYVIVEAMMAGCPVIGTNSGSIPNVIAEGGIVVPEHDSQAISDAMQKLSSTEVRNQLAKSAINSAKRFDEEIFKENIIEYYQALI